jgi:hypothetical protein
MDVARKLHLPKATADALIAKGDGLRDADIKRALVDAGRPASKADVAHARELLLAQMAKLNEDAGETSKDLRRASSSQDASISFEGGNAKTSPATSRPQLSNKEQRDAKNLAEGSLLRFVLRNEISPAALKGELLKQAFAAVNEGYRTISGEPSFSENVVKTAAAMLSARGVTGEKAKALSEPKIVEALFKRPVEIGAVLGRVLDCARALHLDESKIWFRNDQGVVRPDEHVFNNHRSFVNGVLDLAQRIAAGEKITNDALQGEVQKLCERASAEYALLLEKPQDVALHEELRGVKANSEPLRTGFMHALGMLYVLQSESHQPASKLLASAKVAKAFAEAVQNMAGRPEYSRDEYNAMTNRITR